MLIIVRTPGRIADAVGAANGDPKKEKKKVQSKNVQCV